MNSPGLGIGIPLATKVIIGGPGAGVDDLLLETGDHLLLETGDAIRLE